MNLPFTGSTLSWSHRGHTLFVDVHPAAGPPPTADGPLVEWEALARYLSAGADGALALLITGDRGIDAGLCWSSLSGRLASGWAALPTFVSRFGAGGDKLIDRVTAVWKAVEAYDAPSVAVVTGACARGGFELVGAVDEVVAERRPGLDDQLRAAGVSVDRWVDPGEGPLVALGALGGGPASPVTRRRAALRP